MAAEELAERAAKLVEADSMASATGLYISKGYLIGLMAVSGAIGGVVAYIVGKKRLETKYEELAKKEIEEAKAFYSVLNKRGEFSTPEKAANALLPGPELTAAVDALQKYQGREEDVSVIVESDVTVVKQSEDRDFDLEEEMKDRSPDVPYVISQEEYLMNEPDHSQTAITYYVGDKTLADEQEKEIPMVDPIVGEDNLLRFGHGSGDPRVVFIRNEKLAADFEVYLNDGKYAHEVLGLEHSNARERQRRNQPRKFRGEDG